VPIYSGNYLLCRCFRRQRRKQRTLCQLSLENASQNQLVKVCARRHHPVAKRKHLARTTELSFFRFRGSPIVIDAYASGELPLITGADLMPAGAWSACNPCGTNIWAAPLKAKTNVVIFDGAKETGNRPAPNCRVLETGFGIQALCTFFRVVSLRHVPASGN